MILRVRRQRIRHAGNLALHLYGQVCTLTNIRLVTNLDGWTVRFVFILYDLSTRQSKDNKRPLCINNLQATFDVGTATWKLTDNSIKSVTYVFKAQGYMNIPQAITIIEKKLLTIKVIQNK